MRVENGEILDVIYIADSLLVATTIGVQTFLVIAKDDTVLSCVPDNDRMIEIS